MMILRLHNTNIKCISHGVVSYVIVFNEVKSILLSDIKSKYSELI